MILLKLFGFLFLFVGVFVLMFVLSLVFGFWRVIRQILGGTPTKQAYGQRQNSQFRQQQNQQDSWYRGENFSSNGTQQSASQSTVSGQPKPRTSQIDKNEGEYVDYEEIS